MIGIGSNKKIIDIYNEIKAGDLKPKKTEVLVVNGQQKSININNYL